MILISLLLYFCDLHSVASRRRNQNLFNDIFHTAGKSDSIICFWMIYFTIGFDQIGRGKLASTIPEMLSVQSISFEFKVQTSNTYFYSIIGVSSRYTLPTTAEATSSHLQLCCLIRNQSQNLLCLKGQQFDCPHISSGKFFL